MSQGSEAILRGTTMLAMGHDTFVNTLVLMCQCRSIHCSAIAMSDGPVGHVVGVYTKVLYRNFLNFHVNFLVKGNLN